MSRFGLNSHTTCRPAPSPRYSLALYVTVLLVASAVISSSAPAAQAPAQPPNPPSLTAVTLTVHTVIFYPKTPSLLDVSPNTPLPKPLLVAARHRSLHPVPGGRRQGPLSEALQRPSLTTAFLAQDPHTIEAACEAADPRWNYRVAATVRQTVAFGQMSAATGHVLIPVLDPLTKAPLPRATQEKYIIVIARPDRLLPDGYVRIQLAIVGVNMGDVSGTGGSTSMWVRRTGYIEQKLGSAWAWGHTTGGIAPWPPDAATPKHDAAIFPGVFFLITAAPAADKPTGSH